MKFKFYLFLFLFFSPSCYKRADDFNPELIGTWVNRDSCQDIIEIFSDGRGKYRVSGYSKECKSGSRANGRAKFNEKYFFIRSQKFYFVSMPETIDTVYNVYMGKSSVMSMKLTKSNLNGGQTYTYYRVLE